MEIRDVGGSRCMGLCKANTRGVFSCASKGLSQSLPACSKCMDANRAGEGPCGLQEAGLLCDASHRPTADVWPQGCGCGSRPSFNHKAASTIQTWNPGGVESEGSSAKKG